MNAGAPNPLPRRLRALALLLGVALLAWLPIEDTQLFAVILFATFIAALAGAQLAQIFQLRPFIQRLPPAVRWGLWALIAGILIAPLAVLLMALKTGLHGHSRPDFTADQVLNVLRRAPIFMLSATLFGLGVGLYRASKSE